MRKFLYILTPLLLVTACTGDEMDATVGTTTTDGETIDVSVNVDITPRTDVKAPQRVTYTPYADVTHPGLDLTWGAEEQLGVYIKQANGIYKRAGQISSTTGSSTGTRTFTGKVIKLNDGEQYFYLHPDRGNAINFTNQNGELGSTTHLNDLVPLVWEGDNKNSEAPFTAGAAQNNGYAIHLTLSFNEDPGTLQDICIQTMDMGNEDQVFASRFVPSNMAATDLAKSITLHVTDGTTTNNGDGTWTADAYMACSHIDKNVFRTKFNVKVTASNGTFQCDYRSFPGQETIYGDPQLQMLANGKCYNLSRKMSKAPASTVINSTFGVYSLLGMWNTYGQGYDPSHCIITDESLWPTQLRDNKAAILSRYQNNGTGTPTFLSMLYHSQNSLSADGCTQSNVSFNNIQITQPTEVYITFVSEYGWNQNSIGYYHYPTGAFPYPSELVPMMRKTIIWPNVSKAYHEPFNKQPGGTGLDANNIGQPANAPLYEFETVRLLYTDANGYTSTIFPAGTTIGFVMMIDTKANQEQPKTYYDLLDWQQWRIFSNSAWNAHNTTDYIQTLAAANGMFLPDGFKPNGEWTGSYLHKNFFASGDVSIGNSPIPGLAIYGVKDKANDAEDENTAYGAMIYMISTSNPAAMQTQNKAYFNIGEGNIVINK